MPKVLNFGVPALAPAATATKTLTATISTQQRMPSNSIHNNNDNDINDMHHSATTMTSMTCITTNINNNMLSTNSRMLDNGTKR